MFSKEDQDQIASKGLTINKIKEQISLFEKGFPFMEITEPATVKNGIVELSDEKIEKCIEVYEKNIGKKDIRKFVPASGAASRMFKDLFEFMMTYKVSEEEYLEMLSDRSPNSIFYFFENLRDFAFWEDLRTIWFERTGDALENVLDKNEYKVILKALLDKNFLNYGNMPKGLIKFHNYQDFSRTAVEEHLVESANCCRIDNMPVKIHFTVAEDAMQLFKDHLAKIQKIHEEKHGVTYEISYSVQDPSTDTIAVDENNEPFRDVQNHLIFRPGGHGALIKNLNEIDADIIFIKNIDNIVPDRLKDETIKYKKVLAGILLQTQQTIFRYLERLESGEKLEDAMLTRIGNFIKNELCVLPTEEYQKYSYNQKVEYLKNKLNRPIRICGMVLNEGEPGGGPFFAVNPDGTQSLHIVESSQIDQNDKAKEEIVSRATHFNPVDLVCGLKNYKGEKFDLTQFIDGNTGFISLKSKDGKDLKALEWPGLWNGAMSDWNTIFVEVPIETFNPVKIVNDLLREEHRTIAYL